MKVKKINRYYCDFCKKASCSGGHIKKHEERCTLNPNRKCGVCKMLELETKPMSELISILPDSKKFIEEAFSGSSENCYSDNLSIETNKVLPILREKCGDCPACIMAALRQANIPIPITNFNFAKEMQDIWTDINKANKEQYDYNY